MFFHSRIVTTSITNNSTSYFSLYHQLNSKTKYYADLLYPLGQWWLLEHLHLFLSLHMSNTDACAGAAVCMSLHCKSAADIQNVCGQTAAACGAWKGAKHKCKECTTKDHPFCLDKFVGYNLMAEWCYPHSLAWLSNHSSPAGSTWTTLRGKKELKHKQRNQQVKNPVNSKSWLIHASPFI